MRTSHGRVRQQAVERPGEVHGLVEHLLDENGAVGHVAEHHRLGTRHEREFEAFGRVAVGANRDLVHPKVCGGHFSPLGEKEEAPGGLTAHTEGQRRIVSSVVHTVNGSGNEGGLPSEHVEGRFGEPVVNVAVIGHVNFEVAGMVTEFEVEPDTAHVTGALIGGDGVEPKHRW